MTTQNAGILSIAVGYPKNVRTNEWFIENQRAVYEDVEKKTLASMFKAQASDAPKTKFDETMQGYLRDPFRGTKQRRIMAEGQSQIDLEADVAKEAMAKAGLTIEDIDHILVASFPNEHPGIGDGVFLAQKLGTRKPAWNVETACSSGIAALQMASAMVTAGQAERVLVVVSCVYSKQSDWSDTLTWFLGDGVGAYVVGKVPEGEGFASFHAVNTQESCGAFMYKLEVHDGAAKPVIRAGHEAGKALRDLTPRAIRECSLGAVKKAGLTLDDVDFFITNTPLAWMADLFCETLQIPSDRTISTYEELANMGPALNPANLHAALARGLIKPGATVLLFAVGSVSSAAAAVVRLGDVAVGARVER